jgi:hypothetical protein
MYIFGITGLLTWLPLPTMVPAVRQLQQRSEPKRALVVAGKMEAAFAS